MNGPVSLNDFDSKSPAARELLFYWQREQQTLHLKYQLSGTDKIIWPTQENNQRSYELWRSTCFELFVRRHGHDDYLEYNFSPDGRWDAYHFLSYRTPQPPKRLESNAPLIHARLGIVEIKLELPWAQGELYANPTAVIEDDSGIHYFAHKHNQEKPDFHAPNTLTLKL